MTISQVVILLAAAAGVIAVIVLLRRLGSERLTNQELQKKQADILQRYGPLVSLDDELKTRTKEVATQVAEREKLVADYARDVEVYQRLKAEVALLQENLEDMSFGVYKPHYGFDASEKYKAALDEVWEKKKGMLRAGTAAICDIKWTVGGSEREGARMTKQNIKVMLRAFNGEADAAVAKVAWNNVTTMEERINRAFSAINELGTTNKTHISPQYRDLALAELRLSYEFAKKKHEEQEEQRELRERMREEERAQREFEQAQKDAATEQARYEKALAKARQEATDAKGQELDAANGRIRELEAKVAEAQAKGRRAQSMAEQTKTGTLYVVSNIGAFGEKVFKIGMTRRLEPRDRVHELGDASVPFHFDIHALIPSDDVPALEREFHKTFEDRSVNLVNMRKEFFELHLDEIEKFAKQKGLTVEFTRLAEAREYRQTIALREKAAQARTAGSQQKQVGTGFPSSLPSQSSSPAPGIAAS